MGNLLGEQIDKKVSQVISFHFREKADSLLHLSFKSFSFKGVELDQLLELSTEDFAKLCDARVRRRFSRGLGTKPMHLINKLRKAKVNAPANEKPAVVKTHLRNMIVVPEMIGSVVGIYNGKVFNTVEIKPEMVGHYLGEFSITYNPVQHGKASTGSKLRLY
ncbi:40S ribosomal protein S15 [Pichia kudriavzevii]|uniref:40S ribosomal protein S15 n=1 Tax=Pichia kudriavzevii TaxID=4909 RepID=A0A1Z8JV96_PICKU|nr:40S ribosomal protein S15 [Pichia kudriavzevii]